MEDNSKFHNNITLDFNKKSKNSLSVGEYNGNSIHVVDMKDPRSVALLKEAYRDVYEPAFPIAEERESIDAWINNLMGKSKNSNIVVVIVGTDFDAKNPNIKGISVGYYYYKVDAGLLAYNAIAPAARNEGLGRVMVEARKQALLHLAEQHGQKLKGVFLECNDPAKVKPEEDSIDPATRMKIFEKWGAKVIPIDYVQPALEKGAAKCDKFKLMAYPHPKTGHYPTPDAVRAFVTGIYQACTDYCGGPKPADDPDYVRTVRQLEALKRAAQDPRPRPPSL